MNREQAKIIGAMTDEQLKAVDLRHYIYLRDIIVAFGEGKRIQFNSGGWQDFTTKEIDFSYEPALYRIVTPKITFNGVEIDAPIDLTKHHRGREKVWHPRNSMEGLEPLGCHRSSLMDYSLAWKTEEACQLYCDTHNKMMGIE